MLQYHGAHTLFVVSSSIEYLRTCNVKFVAIFKGKCRQNKEEIEVSLCWRQTAIQLGTGSLHFSLQCSLVSMDTNFNFD